jgi:hypothetical protein
VGGDEQVGGLPVQGADGIVRRGDPQEQPRLLELAAHEAAFV